MDEPRHLFGFVLNLGRIHLGTQHRHTAHSPGPSRPAQPTAHSPGYRRCYGGPGALAGPPAVAFRGSALHPRLLPRSGEAFLGTRGGEGRGEGALTQEVAALHRRHLDVDGRVAADLVRQEEVVGCTRTG
jgi:hypothetical protein